MTLAGLSLLKVGKKVFPMILAIDIGGTQFSLLISTLEGRIVKRANGRTNRVAGADWMVNQVLEVGRKLLDASPEPIKACGIGFGGPVDFEAQRIIKSTHVSGWDDFPLPKILQKELGISAIIDNDANLGGLGEFTFGVGRGRRNLVYYTVSTGIGGGIVLEGSVYRGSDGNAGELGHVPVLLDGPECACGNRGCLEAMCSGIAIGHRGEEALRRYPNRGQSIRRLASKSGMVTAKMVFDAAREGDDLAQEIVEEVCVYLGMGLATIMNTFAPDVIVVGGGISKAGQILLGPLRVQVDRFTMQIHRPRIRVMAASLKEKSVLMGAIALAKSIL